jgi:hypothetical protein
VLVLREYHLFEQRENITVAQMRKQHRHAEAAPRREGSAKASWGKEDEMVAIRRNEYREAATRRRKTLSGGCIDAVSSFIDTSLCLDVQFNQQIGNSFTYRSKLNDVHPMFNNHDKSKPPTNQASMSKPVPRPSPCHAIIDNHHKSTKGQKIQLHS